METWPRADQTYPDKGHWHGRPIEAMAGALRAAYDKAQAATPGLSREQVAALEQVAFDQLAPANAVEPAPAKPGPAGHPARCATAR